MILDLQNLLSDQQSMVNAIGTYNSTNVIDQWGSAAPPTIPGVGGSIISDIGRGKTPEVLCQITVQPVGPGASVQFQLVQCDDAAYTNPVVLQETIAIPIATLVTGYQARLNLAPGVTKRCVFVRYVISGAALTAGNFSAGLMSDGQTNPFVGA